MGKKSRDRRREAARQERTEGTTGDVELGETYAAAPRVPKVSAPQPRAGDPGGFALGALATTRQEILRLEARRARQVGQARQRGCTWAEIAEVLGCSPQAVQQRYGRQVRR